MSLRASQLARRRSQTWWLKSARLTGAATPIVCVRELRGMGAFQFRPPWPFKRRRHGGLMKVGPAHDELSRWPTGVGGENAYAELSPLFQNNNHPGFDGWLGEQPTFYIDAETGEKVEVPEMIPELVVPDLTNFKLKPYVSYRTDYEIEQRMKTIRSEPDRADVRESIGEDWPPPKVDPKFLFDRIHREQVEQKFKEGFYDKNESIFEDSSDETIRLKDK